MAKRKHSSTVVAVLLFLLLIPGFLVTLPQDAFAQDPPEESDSDEAVPHVALSEESLRFHGTVDESLQRTFTAHVTGGPIRGLHVVVHDLVDEDTGLAILSTDVNVNPATKDAIESPQLFAVAIGAGQKPGHYVGKLELVYDDQPDDVSLEVALDATLQSVPKVAAEVNSKNLVLSAAPEWYSLPFGRPRVGDDAPEMGEVVIILLQDAEGEATVEQVDILTIRGSKNETLPLDAITVTSDVPFKLSGQDAASIRIIAQGRNLPADSYDTTVRARIRNQPESVQVPLKVQIKDGPLLPILLLAAGPLIGLLLGLWNTEGKAKYDLQRRIEKVRRRTESAEFVQAQDRALAMSDLEKAMDAMVKGEAVAQITERVEKVETFVTERQEKGKEFVTGEAEPVLANLQAAGVGKLVRAELVSGVQDLIEGVTRGEFKDLAEARSRFKDLSTSTGQLLKLAEQFDKLPPGDDKEEKRKKLDTAQSLQLMDGILNPPPDGLDMESERIAGDEAAIPAERKPELIAWDRYTLRLKWWRLAVTAIVYLFTLVVGWVTIYASSPTFGSDPENYITLFLWGVTASVVGAGTISLQSIFDKAKQEDPPPSD